MLSTENIAVLEAHLLSRAGEKMPTANVMRKVFAREGEGGRRDVDAEDLEGGDRRSEEGVEGEGDAAGAGAEVEDAEG